MSTATTPDMKALLLRCLQRSRDSLLWKLEGVSDYDARRPLVPTGTNLLGIVKHVASVEAGYLGDVFGRNFPETFPWFGQHAAPDADMWVTADESRESTSTIASGHTQTRRSTNSRSTHRAWFRGGATAGR